MADDEKKTQFMAGKVNEVTADTFGEFKAQPGVSLLDVWAIWCGPCKMIAPVVDELAEELHGRLNVGKLDADQYIDSVREYGVMSIPTLLIFKDGELVDRMVGFRPKAAMLDVLEKHLPKQEN